MHRRIIVAVAILVGSLAPFRALAAPAPVQVHAAAHAPAPVMVAPADEYFGRMKMSILGITNSIRDTGIREGFNPSGASQYYSSLSLTENALEDWAAKYPRDSWIPKRAYDMSHEFYLMRTSDGNVAANRCRSILFRQFPHNHWAVIARHESARTVAPVAAVAAAQTPAPATH